MRNIMLHMLLLASFGIYAQSAVGDYQNKAYDQYLSVFENNSFTYLGPEVAFDITGTWKLNGDTLSVTEIPVMDTVLVLKDGKTEIKLIRSLNSTSERLDSQAAFLTQRENQKRPLFQKKYLLTKKGLQPLPFTNTSARLRRYKSKMRIIRSPR